MHIMQLPSGIGAAGAASASSFSKPALPAQALSVNLYRYHQISEDGSVARKQLGNTHLPVL